ncbi:hypothetical protein SELMODRAFT_266960 [Selaginella moellendorffii]|uniref:Enoyl reductase (ER) domain-containing protein n=1 Tax=Selaginella moellendorffii TaxID=88036 RepID=D8R4H1_SELML|nr:zinc-type alcohol dehydrogenase-like protein C1198.01 [Selaginella moellendorffii]EFJ33470.1 hypothetical protein SELMODRAFT_266960 [Selaginella moellendorffii]|eukprot:XP_002966050.1 zinc-type alcohol dehydrogenase-like protein C1198.01 [Selaginella moellendorffii]
MMNAAAQALDEKVGKVPVAQGSTRPATSDTEVMRAITWQGKKTISLDKVPKPVITHPKDVIVKVTACTICSGSDSHVYAGEVPDTSKGQIMGHEGCGVVSEVGEAVTKFKAGDRVVIAFDIACGECDYCKRGEFTGCDTTNDSKLSEFVYGHRHSGIFGYGNLLGGVPGSQAEFVRVPFADVNCYKIPDEVPDEKALYLSDVLCTSYHAVMLAGGVKAGETVAIWGLGPIGLCAARWCQIMGASKVVGIDFVKERLEVAEKKLGITVIDRNSVKDVPKRIFELVPGGVDASIEAAGFRFPVTILHKVERTVGLETDTADILNELLLATRKWGRVSVIADYLGYCNHFGIGMLMMKHLTLRSGQCPCQRYFDTVMDHVKSGKFDPSFMVTHRIKLEDAPEAYSKLFNKEDGYIKVFIEM